MEWRPAPRPERPGPIEAYANRLSLKSRKVVTLGIESRIWGLGSQNVKQASAASLLAGLETGGIGRIGSIPETGKGHAEENEQAQDHGRETDDAPILVVHPTSRGPRFCATAGTNTRTRP